jgi:hypothetical protein
MGQRVSQLEVGVGSSHLGRFFINLRKGTCTYCRFAVAICCGQETGLDLNPMESTYRI